MDHAITVGNLFWLGLSVLGVVGVLGLLVLILNVIAQGWKH